MSEKRKISVRKILQATVTMLVTGICVFALLSASRLQRNEKIKEVSINIKNAQYGFIDKNEIETFLANNHGGDILNVSVSKLDENKIEKTVVTNPWVADAEVYADNKKVVHINLTQRVPVARIFDQAGNSYYLDKNMKTMPLSEKYVHYTTVVTNVPVMTDDSLSNDLKAQIAKVVSSIDKDSFWRAQVSQVVVNNERAFELVPVLGSQKIILGDTTRLNDKLENLMLFYKRISNKIGWEKYEQIDLRYAGQIIASPALPWKAPVVTIPGGMDWVSTVIGKDSNMYKVDSSTMRLKQTKPVVVPKAHLNLPKPKPVVKEHADNKAIKKSSVAKPQPLATTKPPPKAAAKKEEHKKTASKPVEKTNAKEKQPKYLYQ